MFESIKKQLQENIGLLLIGQDRIFLTEAPKDVIWDTYITSFVPESGLQQENNCNACRSFIKTFGGAVVVVNNQLKSIWDFQCGDPTYQKTLDALRDIVLAAPIDRLFVTDSQKIGVDFNFQELENGKRLRREHFFCELPKKFVTSNRLSLDTVRGDYRTTKGVFKRSLDELSEESVQVVLELIDQNSIYRGAEFRGPLQLFLTLQREYKKLTRDQQDLYAWVNCGKHGTAISNIRNTAIGTMLIDISGGMDLDLAVSRFEKIMAPQNYKRPNAVVSKKMVEEAEKTIVELGFADSLERKIASPEDININNLFFTDRSIKKKGIFDELKDDSPVNIKKLGKVDEIGIEDFIEKIVPKADSVEILLEPRHTGNMFSLIAPAHKDAPTMFKWGNGFSWCYKNAFADAVKEKVKAAGGKIDGMLRISLEWFSRTDLDLRIIEPDRRIIYYADKKSPSGGHLDVDMNAYGPSSDTPVENVIYPYGSKMKDGKYRVQVHCFSYRRRNNPVNIQMESNGETYDFTFEQDDMTQGTLWEVVEFEYTQKGGIVIGKNPNGKVASQEVWGINTNRFHKVSMGMFSPNYWDDNKVGNKHVMFALSGARNNDESIRGFFNEALKPELEKNHKRVFEVLAGRLKVEKSDNPNQISGLGFSTTQENSFICRVKGSFERVLKVKI